MKAPCIDMDTEGHIFKPTVLSNRPVDEAKARSCQHHSIYISIELNPAIPMIPLPMPLITPTIDVNTCQ